MTTPEILSLSEPALNRAVLEKMGWSVIRQPRSGIAPAYHYLLLDAKGEPQATYPASPAPSFRFYTEELAWQSVEITSDMLFGKDGLMDKIGHTDFLSDVMKLMFDIPGPPSTALPRAIKCAFLAMREEGK